MKCAHGQYGPDVLGFAPNCEVCWDFPVGFSAGRPFQKLEDGSDKFMGTPSTHGFTPISNPTANTISAGQPHHYDCVDFHRWLCRKLGLGKRDR